MRHPETLVRSIELRALQLGALDPSRERELRARIAASPALQARFTASRVAAEAIDRGGWRVPRLRAARGAEPVAHFGPRGRRTVRIPRPPDASERHFVLLVREAGAWRCAFPRSPAELFTLDALAVVGDAMEFEWDPSLVPAAEAWAVALPPRSLPIDWQAEETQRWAAVIWGVSVGEVPAWPLRLEGSDR